MTPVSKIESLPFADGSFDAVLATGVLEYSELERALPELARVLRPGGLAVVSYPNPRNLYGLWKTRAWYRLPHAERQRIMDAHIAVGHKYHGIKINTTYSFGLDDQEFVVAFEGDHPGEFLALVRELRDSEASSYTERDTPMFTCRRLSPSGLVEAIGLA